HICPSCHTDISLIRSLEELPQQPKSWTREIAILMLVIGVTIGAGGSFFSLQTALYTTTTPHRVPKVTNSPTPSPQIITTTRKQPPILATYNVYNVKSGDTLSGIAGRLCNKPTDWQLIVAVNPELQKRENKLDINQVLKIPSSCKGKTP
ncbi:LysM peptidoglycan-binding domain-containing protein, partial [Dolichospermum circinale CS-545/17]|nr:LysM peptidoglycan-binding domain-containing protein [Dolichospermum circinale CS-545/17]